MKIDNLKPEDVVGRWVFYRRTRGFHGAELRRAFIQNTHPGQIVGMLHSTHAHAYVYPRRPLPCSAPLLLPLEELEIHAVVEPVEAPPESPG